MGSTHVIQRWQLGETLVTRVVEQVVALPPSLFSVGADPAALLALPWAQPEAGNSAGEFLFAFSICCLERRGRRVVLDPGLAFDARLEGQDGASLAESLLDTAMVAADFRPDTVDLVINTHIDGLGWNLRPDGAHWRPSFPRANYLFSQIELDTLMMDRSNPLRERLQVLDAAGLLAGITAPLEVLPGLHLEHAPGHAAGYMDIWLELDQMVFAGHSLLNPLQVADPDWGGGDAFAEAAGPMRRQLLARAEAAGALLLGPHFAGAGAGHVLAEGGAWRYQPVPGDMAA